MSGHRWSLTISPSLPASGRIVGVGEANNAVRDGEDVLRPVADLRQQPMLGRFQRLYPPVLRHVDLRSKKIKHPSVVPMDGT